MAPRCPVHLVVTHRDRPDSIERNLDSVAEQVYRNLRVTYIDDASLGQSLAVIGAFRERIPEGAPPIKWVFNDTRRGIIPNVLSAIQDDPPETVVVLLDGDDSLSSPFSIERIAKEYLLDDDTWLTYGSFLTWPEKKVIYAGPYYPDCIEKNLFRKWFWRCAKPHSFRVGLLRAVPESYFRDDDGSFWELAVDQALLLPMLELAGHHIRHIPSILYHYDLWNWRAPTAEQLRAQAECTDRIRARGALQPLAQRPW